MTDERGPDAGPGGRLTLGHATVFLACVAIAIAVGVAVRFVRHAPPPEPPPANSGAAELPPITGETKFDYTFYPMGGIPFRLRVYGRDPREFMYDCEAGENLVEEIEREVSNWRGESVTGRLNAAEPGATVELGDHMAELLRASRHFFELSGGAFNPAIGPLVELWREAERRGSEPTADELAALKPACTMDAFEFDAEKRTCTKLMAGARLDVGAIAKGYAVDRVVELLQARGVASGIVTSGGEVRVFGGTVSRRVGIKDPEKPEALYGYFYCTAGAVSTSGNYERFYTVAGRTYGHIVDPRSFKPTEGPLSVTVLAQNATTSDALSTTIYVLGADEGLKLVETLPGVEALVLVREDGAIKQRRSRGFPEVLDMSELEQPAEE